MSKEIEQRIIEKQDELIDAWYKYRKHCPEIINLEQELSVLRAEQGEKEIDSDVKVYNERQDLEAKFRTPVEQSKLSTEEYYKTECGRFDFGRTAKDGFVSARQKDIERFAEEYHSQFEGKELPEEELRKELVKFIIFSFKVQIKEGRLITDDEVITEYLKNR